MPPNPQDIHSEQWLDIADFSPGAYNHTNTTTGGAPSSKPDRLLRAPAGAHDPAGTFSCLCLPDGGIGALPRMTTSYSWPGTNETINYTVGFLAHNELADGTTEVFVIWEADDGTHHMWDAYSYIVESGSFNSIVSTFEATGSGIFGSPYPQFTRMANTNPTTTDGLPVIVFPNGGPASPTNPQTGQLYAYPDPAAPTTFTAMPLITAVGSAWSSISGQVLVHQSRVIVLAGVTYDYPAGGGFETNEQINYTDPPNSTDYGNQMTVLGAEEPFGYGAGGSISAGELFLVKKRGGGLIVSGDIFSPTVTFLPGVQPTGLMYGQGSSGMDGFFYCSLNNGAWLWNGSNTSEKISNQLEDNFFLPKEYNGGMESDNYGFFVQCIGDKAYFSNNWLYDMRTQSWWKYYPDSSQGGTDFYYVNPVSGPVFYAAPLSYAAAAPWLYKFDQNVPAQSYQWQSLPLKLTGEDRLSDIREVVIRASSTSTNGEITLTILDQGATVFGPVTMPTTVTDGPEIIRFTVAALGVQEPQIRINVVNTGTVDDMPVVHSISVAYRQRSHQASINA